jgi:hypothetical protein
LSLGKATSSAPICNGMTMLPKAAGMEGMTTMKIMITPCSVNTAL